MTKYTDIEQRARAAGWDVQVFALETSTASKHFPCSGTMNQHEA